MKFLYVETPTDKLAYQLEDVEADNTARRAAALLRLVQLRQWLDAHLDAKFSALSGTDKLAYDTSVAALKDACSKWVQSHLVARGDAGNKVSLALATYAALWDGEAPFVVTVLGAFPAKGIAVMGWPQTDVRPDPVQEALSVA